MPCIVSGGFPHFDETPCMCFVHMTERGKLAVIFLLVLCMCVSMPHKTWNNSLGSYTVFQLLGFNASSSPNSRFLWIPTLILGAYETMGSSTGTAEGH